MNYSEDDTFIGVLPFFHIYGQIVVLMTGLKAGSKIVTMPKFDPEQYLKLAQEHQVRLNLLPRSHPHNPQSSFPHTSCWYPDIINLSHLVIKVYLLCL